MRARVASRLGPRRLDGLTIVLSVVLIAAAGAAMPFAPFAVAFTAVALASVAVAAKRPDAVTLLVLAVLYSNAAVVGVRMHEVPFVIGALVPFLLLAPLAYHTLVRGRPLRLGAAGPWLVALLVLHVASALVSADTPTGLSAAVAFATDGLGLYLLLLNVLRSTAIVRDAALTVVAVAGGAGALSTFQMLTGTFHRLYFGFSQVVYGDLLEPLTWRSYDVGGPASEIRAAGFIGEPNFYAYVLVAVLPFAIAFAWSPARPLERWIGLSASPFILAGIVVTYSRGAAVVIGVTVVLLAIVGILPRRMLVLGGVAGMALLMLVPAYGQRLVGLAAAPAVLVSGGAADVEDAAIVGRYSEMVAAAHAFVDHPVLGLGPGQFPARYQSYARPLGFFVHEGEREPHNLYLHFAAELGLFGLLALLGVFAALLRRLLVVRRRVQGRPGQDLTAACIATLTIIAVNGMFLHLAYLRYLAMLLALLAAWGSVASEPDGAEPAEGAPATAQAGPAEARRAG